MPSLASPGRIVFTDPDGDDATTALVQAPTQGSVTVGADGRFTYTSIAQPAATDGFQVRIRDGNGGELTVTQPVAITVPGMTAPHIDTAPPVAVRQNQPLVYAPRVTSTWPPTPALGFSLLGLDGVPDVVFDTTTGALNWAPGRTIPTNGHYRFGILVRDSTTGRASYQPILLKVIPGGAG